MSHYTHYFEYHLDLLRTFKTTIGANPIFTDHDNTYEQQQDHQKLLETLEQLGQMQQHSESLNQDGQWMVNRIITAYPQFTHLLPRDLLWFFGGDCLHFMPDEEIAFYQALDELRFSAEARGQIFNYAQAKKQLQQMQ